MIQRMAVKPLLALACGLGLSACLGTNPVAECNDAFHVINEAYKACEIEMTVSYDCDSLANEVCDLAPYFECFRSSVACEDGGLVQSQEPCALPEGCERFGNATGDPSDTDTDTN